MAGPLTGYRVVDLTSTFSGPFATQMLGDFGADVIKVESPSGDITRGFAPSRSGESGSVFLNINRGKRSVVLDLKDPAGRDTFIDLLATADAFVHNVRPSAMARLGLSYADVAPRAPHLVYCVITGFGSGGRYSGYAAYDDVVQGMSGMAWLQGRPAGVGAQYIATAIADKTAGMYAAFSVVSALLHRGASGAGQHVEVPMFETLASYALAEQLGGRAFSPALGPTGYARMRSPHRKPFATADSYICVVVYTEAHWRSFLGHIGRAELLEDERFATVAARSVNVDALYEMLADALRTQTTEFWLSALRGLDIPVMPVLTLDDLFDDDHLADVGMFEEFDHPAEGRLVGVRNPVVFGTTPLASPSGLRPPPRLGEHTQEVTDELAQLGADRSESDVADRV